MKFFKYSWFHCLWNIKSNFCLKPGKTVWTSLTKSYIYIYAKKISTNLLFSFQKKKFQFKLVNFYKKENMYSSKVFLLFWWHSVWKKIFSERLKCVNNHSIFWVDLFSSHSDLSVQFFVSIIVTMVTMAGYRSFPGGLHQIIVRSRPVFVQQNI